MKKLQPEGGYEAIRAGSPAYRASLEAVAVFAMTCEEMTGKLKLGQKLSAGARASVEQVLENRRGPMDPVTLAAMRTQA